MTPLYTLQGKIKIVKEIKLTAGYIERHYRDEMGRKAIVLMKDLGNQKK